MLCEMMDEFTTPVTAAYVEVISPCLFERNLFFSHKVKHSAPISSKYILDKLWKDSVSN